MDEELDSGGEEGKLDFDGLVVEGGQIVLEEAVGVLDAVGVLADDPDDGGLGFGFVELVDVLNHVADDVLVLVGVLAEDVADHNRRLLDDVGNLRVDQFQQSVDALFCGGLDLDGELSDGTHCLAHEVDVDLSRIPTDALVVRVRGREERRTL